MKAGSETKMVKRGSRENTPAGSVGQPEKDLAMDKPVKVAEGKPKKDFVRMSIHRAFQLIGEDGETYSAKEGDIVDVPADVAAELDRKFSTYYDHDGMVNKKNAKRTEISRATRI